MKQPKIKIFGQIYKVIQIEFDNTGLIKKIVYQINARQNKTVFKGTEITNKSLTSKSIIKEPTCHPYHNYAYAPDLESLLVESY
ncbi:hypothetical protein [Paenibacillus odorifer]|uniref:hypothetical protein n=1 Tax=Paenibacillus odorifer TaxID=189426 RepID=UPI0028A21066|nr:hypothetical protein [Paenibacillus odorifer]